jgi:hypothetical protein
MAELATIISERNVKLGLRNALIAQAERTLFLAKQRFDQLVQETPAERARRELYGSADADEEAAQTEEAS